MEAIKNTSGATIIKNDGRNKIVKCEQCGGEYKKEVGIRSHWMQSSCRVPDDYIFGNKKVENILPENCKKLSDLEEFRREAEGYVYVFEGNYNGEKSYYVGKTTNAKSRIRQHFASGSHSTKIKPKKLYRILSFDFTGRKLKVKEGQIALRVAIEKNTENVYGPNLLTPEQE